MASVNGQRLNLSPQIPELPAQPQRTVFSKAQLIYGKHSGLFAKGAFITLAIFLLPFCSSEPSAFTNNIIFNRGWEFLRLVFIGAALSYGLFSRCQAEIEKEIEVQIESTQNYVSKFLQVSPVFEEGEFEDGLRCDTNKVQTWNSLYSPRESMVMVAEKGSNHHDQPLFLPVRSLKSCISETGDIPPVHDSEADVLATLNSRVEDSIRNAKRENVMSLLSRSDATDVVSPTPIPWSSRSRRLVVKQDICPPPQTSLPHSDSESELQELETMDSPALNFRSSQLSSSSFASYSIPSSGSVSPSPSPTSDQETADDSVSSPLDGVHSSVNRYNTENQNISRNLKHSESFGSNLAVKSIDAIRKCECLNLKKGDERTEGRRKWGLDPRTVEDLIIKNRDGEYALVPKIIEQSEGIENRIEEKLARINKDKEYMSARRTVNNREADALLVNKTHRKTSFQLPPPPPSIEMYERYQRNRRMAREFVEKLKSRAKAPSYIDDGEKEDDDEDAVNDEDEVNDNDDDDDDGDYNDEEEEADEDDDNYGDNEAIIASESVKEINADEVDKKADEFIAKFRQQIKLQRVKRVSIHKIQNRSTDSTG